MPRWDCRRAVILRTEPRSASSRTRFCFESNHILLRAEPHFGKHAQHVRQQRRRGMKPIESACLKTELPEEQDTHSLVILHQAVKPLAAQYSAGGEKCTVLPVQAAGETGVESDGSHRTSRLSHYSRETNF